jgi:hypothetical protein
VTDLLEVELRYLRGLVRQDMRKTERNRRTALTRYGPLYDSSAHDRRIAFLRQVYAALGGNPDNITNLVSERGER